VNEIQKNLVSNGYIHNGRLNIYRSESFSDIAYNDGDESELRILNAIQNASEIDSLSDELEKHCIDWPSTYHLSKRRANLLRPFAANFKNKTVLEIGSGMGPITRLLGESGAIVLALEGTSRRAQATRSRTRDLDNVLVLSEKFEDFKTDLKFDFITLIGVLEYSNLYTNAINPHLEVLSRCYEMLKPGGSLILAIENKLGLKYFAGANEDHVGIPMFGLENRYTANSVRTFGRVELKKLLSDAGFSSSQFNSPLPDYKLTTSVVSESGFRDTQFDHAALVIDSFTSDPQLPSILAFVPELVLGSIAENGLSLDFANSFLVIAGKSSEPINDDKYLAWHFSTNRRKPYCMKTEFIRTSTEQIRVKKSKLSDLTSRGLLAHNFSEEVEYIQGRKLSFELKQVLSLKGWKHSELAAIFNKFYEYLLQFNVSPGQNHPPILLEKNLIDLTPSNMIIDADENLHAFDYEWESDSSIDVRQVLFRSILSLPTLSILAPDENGKIYSVKSLFFLVCDLLKIECSEVLFREFSQKCVDYQREISDYSGSLENFSEFTDSHIGRAKFEPNLIIRKNVERDSAIAERDSAVAERDSAVAERDSAVAERDSAVAERDSAVAERDSLVNSNTWKIFAIYRRLKVRF
jgi:2-polyprenyl-3-methyl-5-hydroxy-6-metoxy-1,4-benzoquinol methylase